MPLRRFSNIEWRDFAPELATDEQLLALERWLGSSIPSAYRDFLKIVNGGSPNYAGVSDPVDYDEEETYLEEFYCLGFSDDEYRMDLIELNEYNRSDECYTVPRNVLMVGGANCVYQVGISVDPSNYGSVLIWHPDCITWNSDQEMADQDWEQFCEANTAYSDFTSMLEYTEKLANGRS